MSPSRTAQYKATIAKLKAEYKGKVDILCGIEWDSLSEDKPENYDTGSVRPITCTARNTGKYYEIDFRPQDLHDCIFDDFDGDPLAAVEALLCRGGERLPPRDRTFWPTSTSSRS